MAVSYSFEGKLLLPPHPSLPQSAIPVSGSSAYGSKSDDEFELTGSGTQTVNFGTISSPGVKGLFILYEVQTNAAPLLLTVNGGNQPIELSPGGFWAFMSPNPSAGITTLSIAFTATCKVRVILLK